METGKEDSALKIGEIKSEKKSGEKILDPLVDKFSVEENPKLDLNVKRILFECKTMKLVKVEKLKKDKSKKYKFLQKIKKKSFVSLIINLEN
jgi:hypothetical protein